MRRYFLAIAIALGLHCASMLVSKAYFGFVSDIGGWLVHGHDIADIPEMALVGFLLVGSVLVLVAIGAAYVAGPAQTTHMQSQPAIEIHAATELRRPEFWAIHYYNVVGTEERGSGEMIKAVFRLSGDQLNDYYSLLYKPEEQAHLISVPIVAGYDVGMQRVDCGENGEEVRYSIGHKDWSEREPLGYESPHFALPAFRWAEVELIARVMERRSAEDAAIAMLLLFPAVYLTRSDNPAEAERALLRAWKQLMPPSPALEEMVRSAVENQTDSELTWSNNAELGWINNGRYSFRNPKTMMTSFEPRRFARIRSFLDTVERDAQK